MIKTILKILYPSKCIFCKKDIEFEKDLEICDECYSTLKFADNTKDILHKKYYDKLYSAVEYEGKITDIIKDFKYNDMGYLYRPLTKLIMKQIQKENIKADTILSVPLHKDREATRGYNQSELLAKGLSRFLKIKYNGGILKRLKTTNHLASCNKKERGNIIHDAFAIDNSEKIKGKTVIIVDDVFTTGATINECCKVLKKNGAKKIIAITVAKVVI